MLWPFLPIHDDHVKAPLKQCDLRETKPRDQLAGLSAAVNGDWSEGVRVRNEVPPGRRGHLVRPGDLMSAWPTALELTWGAGGVNNITADQPEQSCVGHAE